MFPALLFVSILGSSVSAPAASAETRFLVSDWQVVYQAEAELESGDAASLPALLRLLDRQGVVPLTNTADLIYPGAKTFYGHGWMIDYDLDRLDVRAGWALEELTFENFGFAENVIRETDLLAAVRQGKQDALLQDVTPARDDPGTRQLKRSMAVDRARSWYRRNGSWSRYRALKAALSSNDELRQMKALSWLRSGTTRCRGFTLESYRRDIVPLVTALATHASQAVREQASLLLRDHQNYWWTLKSHS